MEFNDIDINFSQHTTDDLEEGMEVYADIGEGITDIRSATVVEVHEKERSVSLSLGSDRMDNPYVVSITRIHRIEEE